MEDQIEPGSEGIKAAVDLVKTAYEDAFAPPAKQVGKALETVGRAVNVALLPLTGVVWGFERISQFVETRVSQKLEERGTKPEDIITPDPDVAVPAVEALRYSKLKEEFASLLASSMDAKTAENVHPSFVEILKQLSPIDAKLLRFFASKRGDVPLAILVHKNSQNHERILVPHLAVLPPDIEHELAGRLSATLDNLSRLGIIYLYTDIYVADDKAYDPLRALPIVSGFLSSPRPDGWRAEMKKGMIRMSVYGQVFTRACLT